MRSMVRDRSWRFAPSHPPVVSKVTHTLPRSTRTRARHCASVSLCVRRSQSTGASLSLCDATRTRLTCEALSGTQVRHRV